jgi:hypothetical protein
MSSNPLPQPSKANTGGPNNSTKNKNPYCGTPSKDDFKGHTEGLEGHIYDCSDNRQTDPFTKTTEEIAEYVVRNYKCPGDIRLAVLEQKLTIMKEPPEPADDSSCAIFKKWEMELKEYSDRKKTLTGNNEALFSLVYGQCSDMMCQKIKSLNEFKEISSNSNRVALLALIKNTAYNYQEQTFRIKSINKALQ